MYLAVKARRVCPSHLYLPSSSRRAFSLSKSFLSSSTIQYHLNSFTHNEAVKPRNHLSQSVNNERQRQQCCSSAFSRHFRAPRGQHRRSSLSAAFRFDSFKDKSSLRIVPAAMVSTTMSSASLLSSRPGSQKTLSSSHCLSHRDHSRHNQQGQ